MYTHQKFITVKIYLFCLLFTNLFISILCLLLIFIICLLFTNLFSIVLKIKKYFQITNKFCGYGGQWSRC